MKKFLIPALLFTLSSYAEDNYDRFYVKLESGVTIPASHVGQNNAPLVGDTKFHTTGVYGGAIGYRFFDYFRVEVESLYRNFTYKASTSVDGSFKQHTKNLNLFWNGYADWRNSTIFTPYLTAGLGYAKMIVGATINVGTVSTYTYPGVNTNNFAWNVGAGLKTNIWENFDFDISYKYVDLGEIKFKNASTRKLAKDPFSIRNHEVTFGISYNF